MLKVATCSLHPFDTLMPHPLVQVVAGVFSRCHRDAKHCARTANRFFHDTPRRSDCLHRPAASIHLAPVSQVRRTGAATPVTLLCFSPRTPLWAVWPFDTSPTLLVCLSRYRALLSTQPRLRWLEQHLCWKPELASGDLQDGIFCVILTLRHAGHHWMARISEQTHLPAGMHPTVQLREVRQPPL